MASLIERPGGRRFIQFVDPDGKRRTVGLGRCPRRAAESAKVMIESLAAAKRSGGLPADHVTRWLAGVGDEFHAELVGVGLASPRGTAATPAIGAFIMTYVDGRTDLKDGTRRGALTDLNSLLEFFEAGGPRPL